MGDFGVFDIVGILIYTSLALIALWGAYCVIIVWMRVAAKRFSTEDAQSAFLDEVDGRLKRRDYDGVIEITEGDPRATPQLILMAVENRKIGFNKARQLVIDRFQRDILADLEYRLSWVNTVIKSAPMVGLLGTVIGMMGAFAQLATSESVKAQDLAGNIQVALITTACGLAIAIPLVLATASINVRIRKMEDLVAYGLSRFFESFRATLKKE